MRDDPISSDDVSSVDHRALEWAKEAEMTDRDEELLAALREVLATSDTVPDQVIAAAKGAFTWRTIDAELAELSFDSVFEGELAGTRGVVPVRTVSFEYGSISVEIEIDDSGRARGLLGQVAPSVPESVEVHHVDGPEPLRAVPDHLGRFSIGGVDPGPIRLLLRFAPSSGPAMLLTEWVTI